MSLLFAAAANEARGGWGVAADDEALLGPRPEVEAADVLAVFGGPRDGVASRYLALCRLLLFRDWAPDACPLSFDLGGAFFPAWLLAAVIGLVVTILVRAGLVHWGVDRRLFGGGFAYIGLFICLSILTWLWFFRT